jgi:DNA-binding NtrC family response regulator
MIPSILVVDDEETLRRSLRHFFHGRGYKVLEAETATAGINLAQDQSPDVILLDLRLPDMDGLTALERIKALIPDSAVVMFTAHGDIEKAVQAMKLGAFDFLPKVLELDQIEARIAKTLEHLSLKRENLFYKSRAKELEGGTSLIGEAPAIQQLRALLDLVAENPTTTVLILGESGTGKELVARWIHYRSARRDKPFLDINCAGLSETLLESELFGHERGAFTDARTLKRGLLEVADGGTIFLDEIGDLPLSVQPKLLKVLETRTFRRVGGTRDITVDVRIVTATNKELGKAVEAGTFRDDLYYRLKVMPIELPPLRARPEDILRLADHFVREFCALLKKRIRGFAAEAQRLLLAYGWPGNVRELKNVTERAMILCQGEEILPAHLPAELQGLPRELVERIAIPAAAAPPAPRPPAPAEAAAEEAEGPLPAGLRSLEEMEREHIFAVLRSTGGNRSQAARVLQISRSTLQDKIKKYGL